MLVLWVLCFFHQECLNVSTIYLTRTLRCWWTLRHNVPTYSISCLYCVVNISKATLLLNSTLFFVISDTDVSLYDNNIFLFLIMVICCSQLPNYHLNLLFRASTFQSPSVNRLITPVMGIEETADLSSCVRLV